MPRKVLASSHKSASAGTAGSQDGDESLGAAEAEHPQAVDIVFGERVRLKDALVPGARELFKRVPPVAGPDAATRHKASGKRAHGHIACVILGKFVAVDPMRERQEGSGQRQHRRLDKVEARGIIVDPAQFLRMNQVLGVVGNDDIEASAQTFLLAQKELKNRVQAVRLGSRTVVRTQRQVNVGEPASHGAHRVLRSRVVRVAAGEDVVVGIANGGEIVFEHPPDHLVFLPQRDQDRDSPLRGRIELALPGRKQTRRRAQFPLEPVECPEKVHDQVVEPAQQNRRRQGCQ